MVGGLSMLNKHRSDFHRWITDKWSEISYPWVTHFDGKGSYLRLWEHKCGKTYIIYGTTYGRKR